MQPSAPDGTRDDLLRQHARELFSKNGLAVPLSDIAKAAGVGVATLYRRYRDKDILILDVYREELADAVQFAIAANSHDDPWKGIEYFLRRSMEQFAADRGMRELILGGYLGGAGWARASSHEELLAALDATESKVTAQLKVLVERARAAGVVRDDFQDSDLLLMTTMAHSAVPVDAPVRRDR